MKEQLMAPTDREFQMLSDRLLSEMALLRGEIQKLQTNHQTISEFQNQQEGMAKVLKYVGAAGITGFISFIWHIVEYAKTTGR